MTSPSTKPEQTPDIAIHIETSDGPEGEARLQQIRERFQVHQTFWSEIHTEGLEDDKFIAGDHWPEQIRKERQEERRPILTYNLLPSFTRQITNKMRQERPQVKVIPVQTDKRTSPMISNLQGTKDYSLADVYSGIIKNIEHVSRAAQAYDTAGQHGVNHGFGYFYLMNEWSKLDPFSQELRIHRVKNSYSVTLDPDAQEADFRDMQDAFMFTNVKKKSFKAKYPDAVHTEFAQAGMGSSYEGWYDVDAIRVAQYFWIKYKPDEVLMLNDGRTVYLSEVKDVLDELEAEQGIYVETGPDGEPMRRKVTHPVCMWQKMTAKEVLEGPLELPFSAIPIFPVLGEELMLDGRMIYESAIRHAKDPQRSYNYWRTAAVETVALAPKAPYMATQKQLDGHEHMYEDASRKNLPYLLYNPDERSPGPPQRQFAAQPAAAELANAGQDGEDMQSIIGLHDASLGRQSNEISGSAIKARQAQGSTSTYQFPDNLNRAIEQCCRLCIEGISKLYDGQRIERIRLPDDTEDFVMINESVKDEQTGQMKIIRDITYGKYDVTMETGTNYATQRQEAADLQLELLKVLGPEKASNIVHLIVKNMAVPGSEEVSAVLRKMLPDELKSEDEKLADLPKGVTQDEEGNLVDESGEPYEPPPTLDQQIQQRQQEIDQASNEVQQAENEAKKAKADADMKTAEAKIATAQAVQRKAELELEKLQGEMATAGQDQPDNTQMMGDIEGIIQRVMKEHETNPEAHKNATAEQVAAAVVEALARTKSYVDNQVRNVELAKE